MMSSIRQAVRAFLRFVGRCVVAPLVIAAGRRPEGLELPVSVHLLVSSKTWRMGLMAAFSLEYFSGKRWKLFIHEDGSVDRRSRERIEARLPGVRFVTRKEADQAAEQLLKNRPTCLRNRSRHNLFLKFFDPMAFAPGDKFLILDADLFFFRRPEFLLQWAEGGERACYYNRDVKEVYCLPRETIEKVIGVSLWECFNSGLLCICREALDLDLSERLLTAFEATAHHPQFFEQTLYALCASAFNRGGPLPAQYEITWNIFRRRDSVCRHYVGPAKFDHLYLEGPASLFLFMTCPAVWNRLSGGRLGS
ncbi:MAG: hypothetical protein ACOYM3_23650 [Terrimicrobiaceae bacterium]